MINHQMTLSYHNDRIITAVGISHNLIHIFPRDGSQANRMISHKATSTIGSNITINKMLYLT